MWQVEEAKEQEDLLKLYWDRPYSYDYIQVQCKEVRHTRPHLVFYLYVTSWYSCLRQMVLSTVGARYHIRSKKHQHVPSSRAVHGLFMNTTLLVPVQAIHASARTLCPVGVVPRGRDRAAVLQPEPVLGGLQGRAAAQRHRQPGQQRPHLRVLQLRGEESALHVLIVPSWRMQRGYTW